MHSVFPHPVVGLLLPLLHMALWMGCCCCCCCCNWSNMRAKVETHSVAVHCIESATPAGWRWLFILEGIPAVLLGVAIWLFLPTSVSKCRLLTPLERKHLQAAIDGTMPPCAETPITCPTTPKTAVLACDLDSTASSSSDGGSAPAAAAAQAAAAVRIAGATLSRSSSSNALAAGLRHSRMDGKPTMQQLLSDLRAAAAHRVVWCSSFWRFLYLLTLNGLIFW